MGADGHHEKLKLRDGAVAWQEIDGETVLLDVATSCYLGVNPSGTLLWSALAAGATRGELVERLRRQFEITEAQAAADVDHFLADCARRNLLSRNTSDPAIDL